MSDPLALSRRAFLGRFAALGALTGTSALLAACGGGNEGGAGPAGVPVVDASTCRGYDPESVAVRQSLGYVDASPHPDQYCSICRFYTAPAGAGDRCGTCQVIPGVSGNGPVSPGGYCRSWAARAA